MMFRLFTGLLLAAVVLFQPYIASAKTEQQRWDGSYNPIDVEDLNDPVREFFGESKLPPDIPGDGNLADNMLLLLQLTDVRQLKNGSYVIHGCQPHNCGAKAAVVMTRNSKIISGAMSNVGDIRDKEAKSGVTVFSDSIFLPKA